jgi:hypothetical protein
LFRELVNGPWLYTADPDDKTRVVAKGVRGCERGRAFENFPRQALAFTGWFDSRDLCATASPNMACIPTNCWGKRFLTEFLGPQRSIRKRTTGRRRRFHDIVLDTGASGVAEGFQPLSMRRIFESIDCPLGRSHVRDDAAMRTRSAMQVRPFNVHGRHLARG